MTAQVEYAHITQSPDIAGGKPRISGHRITVENVVIWHEQMGYSVEEIASLFHLTLSEVHSVMAYYFDHKVEVERSIAESEAFVEQMRQQTPSRLVQRLYERTS